MSAAGIG